MTRFLSIGLTAISICGCVAQPVPVSANSNWTRVSGKQASCVSFAPRHREAVESNVLLTPSFQDLLESQLGAEVPKAPRCWYETPTGDLRLYAGDFCGDGVDAFFEQKNSKWELIKTVELTSTCHPHKW